MPVAADFQVNVETALQQFAPAVAIAPDGSFIVVWASGELSAGGESEIAARIFDPAGGPLSGEMVVNSFTTGRQAGPAVAAAPDGTFVVAWHSPIYGYPDDEIRGRRLDADGIPLGPEFQVNGATTGRQSYPRVSTAGNGDFVVVWRGESDAYEAEVFGRRFSSDGLPAGDDFQINSYTTGFQTFPVVARAPDDGFLVVWGGGGSPGGDPDGTVQARLFSADALPASDQVQVNSYTTGSQSFPKVAASPDGGFVVVWGDGGGFEDGQDGDNYGVFARLVAADGTPAGDEFQINSYTTGSQRLPAVARGGDRFVVVWQGEPGANVFGHRFSDVLVFADGFESGDLASWSGASP